MKRRSLADELAELATPAPAQDRDPLDDGLAEAAHLLDSDDELAALEMHEPGTQRKRMRSDITLEDPAYRGRKSTRQDMFGDAAAFEHLDADDASAEDAGDDAEVDASDDGNSDSLLAGGVSDGRAEMGGSELSSDERQDAGVDDEDSSGADGRRHSYAQEPEGPDAGGDDEDEAAALEREYAQMQAADAAAAADVGARAAADRARGLAVKNQKQLWERVLGLRILLQRSLTASHRLPGAGARGAVCKRSAPVATEYAACEDACRGALADMLDLQAALLERSAEVAEIAGDEQMSAVRDRTRDASASSHSLWTEIEALERLFTPFRDSALDRWHRKTLLATGRAAMKSQLRALNQSLSQQVALLMRDPTRAIARTQLPLATRPRVLCELRAKLNVDPKPSDESDEDMVGERGGGGDSGGAAQSAEGGAGGRAADANTYDDSDFYQLLLREFLEASNVGDATFSAMRAAKVRKVVDRRASKGRKIRYHVMDKLVNYMTPTFSQNDEMVQNVFSNLFGKGAA